MTSSSSSPPLSSPSPVADVLKTAVQTLSTMGMSALSAEMMSECMNAIVSSSSSPITVAAFLSLLQPVSGLPPTLITAAARVLRKHALPFHIPPDLLNHASVSSSSARIIDVVGTGGDGLNTFNASTAAALLVSAVPGVVVVKHGNRSSSSTCGSADFIEALRNHSSFTTTTTTTTITTAAASSSPSCPFMFVFAQQYHPALKSMSSLRSQLGIRSIFNILGPLLNPSDPSPTHQLSGVFARALGRSYLVAFQQLGKKHIMIVHSDDGMDEISPCTTTRVWLWRHPNSSSSSSSSSSSCSDSSSSFDCVEEFEVHPTRDFGLPLHSLSEIKSGTAAENAALFVRIVVHNEHERDPSLLPILHYILLNASAALVLLQEVTNFKQGVDLALHLLKQQQVKDTLLAYVKQYSTTSPSSSSSTATTSSTAAAAAAPSILTEIAHHRRSLVANASASHPLLPLIISHLSPITLSSSPSPSSALTVPAPLSFIPLLFSSPAPMSVLAEFKRASPSAGLISSSATLSAVDQVSKYVGKSSSTESSGGGAADADDQNEDGVVVAISCLAEPKYFRGSLDDLRALRHFLDHSFPLTSSSSSPKLLRRPALLLKDFVEDEYQLVEARCLAGIDTALLIVASLCPRKLSASASSSSSSSSSSSINSPTSSSALIASQYDSSRLSSLLWLSRQLGMEPLVEVANESEMHIALSVGATCIGINNRNLHTFTVDPTTTLQLASLFQQHFQHVDVHSLPLHRRPVLVALSGIKTRQDVEVYENCCGGGVVRAILVGETLMKAASPVNTIKQLVGLHSSPSATTTSSSSSTTTTATTTATTNAATTMARSSIVKVCGVRSVSDALHAMHEGVDLIGLIFVPQSKRYINVSVATQIATALQQYRADPYYHRHHCLPLSSQSRSLSSSPMPLVHPTPLPSSSSLLHAANEWAGDNRITPIEFYNKQYHSLYSFLHSVSPLPSSSSSLVESTLLCPRRPLLVAVFQNASVSTIIETLSAVPSIDIVQLHGDESIELIESVPRPCIRVLSVTQSTTAAELVTKMSVKVKNVVAHLLDTKPLPTGGTATCASVSGGTGQIFDWSVARAVSALGFPVLVAGGVTPSNVTAALQQTAAVGVDTASGVEALDSTAIPTKRYDQIIPFVLNAKHTTLSH